MNDKPEKPKQPEPPEGKRVTLRDIARALGVSHVTVSKALRNQSGASAELRARIQNKAEEMGYIPDPMLSALSHYRKTSKTKPAHSELAWINSWPDPEKMMQFKEFKLYWQGARDNAQRFGYHLEAFNLSEIPFHRLETILKTRNIQGILLPPPPFPNPLQNPDQFDWAAFSLVRFGHAEALPKTHYVTSAQMMNTMQSFNRARELGYKRIGFICEYWHARFFSVGYSWAQKELPLQQRLPELLLNTSDDTEHQKEAVTTWIRQNRPDAIITDKSEIPDMLRDLGYSIPDDIGLVTTSIHDTPIDAGIDQRPYEIGRAAVRILTSLIAERSFGIPSCRNETLIEGEWVDGPMLPPRN